MTEHRHRPVLAGPDDELGAVGDRRPRRPVAATGRLVLAAASRTSPSPRTRRSTSCTCATSRSATRPCRPRTAAGTWRSPTPTATGCSTCGARRRRPQHRAPAAGVRHRHDPGAPRRPGDTGLRPRVVRPATRRSSRPASTAVAATDGFNWGYDPLHYTTPEGSYATDPGGPGRTLEFRRMVAALNGSGLRVVMDVVYNHTTASGQDPKSVLDRIVPGYYHRLSATGAVETSTCCANTASEHPMMEKLMVDSVVTWAREYKVDGFRFDLMGHHSLANMLNRARGARRAHRPARRRRRQAHLPLRRGLELRRGRRRRPVRARPRQLELAGTGIGSFTDRLRDAVAAAGRSTRTRASRASAPACTPTRTARPSTGRRTSSAPGCCCTTTRSRSGLAGNLATTSSSTARARPSRAPTSTTTVSRPATPATRPRRSPTSTPTTTRRCSTCCSTSCRRARRWPTGCG